MKKYIADKVLVRTQFGEDYVCLPFDSGNLMDYLREVYDNPSLTMCDYTVDVSEEMKRDLFLVDEDLYNIDLLSDKYERVVALLYDLEVGIPTEVWDKLVSTYKNFSVVENLLRNPDEKRFTYITEVGEDVVVPKEMQGCWTFASDGVTFFVKE